MQRSLISMTSHPAAGTGMQPKPSLTASPYLGVATIVQSQRIGSGQTRQVSVTNAGMSAGQSDCRKCVNKPL